MTPLEQHMLQTIEAQGPISLASFMGLALGHKEHGYYSAQRPFGVEGDFITAPEISQTFGELVGLWCAQCWIDLGKPSPFNFVELGPGRGTAMADALRAIGQALPEFCEAAQVHLVETSPRLRQVQQDTIACNITWHDQFDQVPDGPLILFANEFVDALPIRQFIKKESGWAERFVGRSEDKKAPALCFVEGPILTHVTVPEYLRSADVGTVWEVCEIGQAVVASIARSIQDYSGAALVIDYGYDHPQGGDTLQAVKKHQFHPVLEQIGTADITAHVDFSALAHAAQKQGVSCWGPITQGDFLSRLGIKKRAEHLCANASPTVQQGVLKGVERLVSQDQMGILFKVLALSSGPSPHPAGYDTNDLYVATHQSLDS